MQAEPWINRAASMKFMVVLPPSKEIQIWSSCKIQKKKGNEALIPRIDLRAAQQKGKIQISAVHLT